MKQLLLGVATSLAVVGGSTAPAGAVVVYDTLTAYNADHTVLATISVTKAEQSADPFATNYLAGVPVNTGLAGFPYSIVLNGGIPVDIIGIAGGGPDGSDLGFSAGEAAAEAYPLENPIEGSGLPISVTMYLSPALQDEGDTAFFTASGDYNIPAIPEPTSVTLFGVGLVGMLVTRRRRPR
jgi:hypothetical protein